MQSVETILKDVYGSESEASVRLGVVRSAISNWKKWGYFPSRLLPRLIADSGAAGVALGVADVPILQKTDAGTAA